MSSFLSWRRLHPLACFPWLLIPSHPRRIGPQTCWVSSAINPSLAAIPVLGPETSPHSPSHTAARTAARLLPACRAWTQQCSEFGRMCQLSRGSRASSSDKTPRLVLTKMWILHTGRDAQWRGAGTRRAPASRGLRPPLAPGQSRGPSQLLGRGAESCQPQVIFSGLRPTARPNSKNADK